MICRYNFFASRIPIPRTHAASRQNGSTVAFVPALHTLSRLNGLSDYGDGFVGWGKPADESPMSAFGTKRTWATTVIPFTSDLDWHQPKLYLGQNPCRNFAFDQIA